MKNELKIGGKYFLKCFDKKGNLKWQDETKNLIVSSGVTYLITNGWSSAYYIGLTSGSPTINATQTMASHTGWAEVTGYNETARSTYSKTISNNSVSNINSKSLFTMNTSVTVGGIFICTISTKSSSSGTLISAAPFSSGDKACISGDLIYVQYDFSASAT